MKVVFTSEAEPPTVATGGGEYNAETGTARARLRLSDSGGRRVEVESVSDGEMVYVRSPQFPGKVPEGKEWLGMRPFVAEGEESAMPGEGPATSLQMLRAAGDVHRAGSERVRGARATRYRASIALEDYAARLRAEGDEDLAEDFEKLTSQIVSPIRSEVSIDAQGIVRRARTMIATLTDEGAVTMDLRMELFDFGAHPDIQLPDSSQVFDMTPLIEEQLDAVGEAS